MRSSGRPSATVFMESWLGYGDPNWRSLRNRDFDADELRLMISSLKYLCWTRWLDDWRRVDSAEEQDLADKIRSFVVTERAKLDRLNVIPARLEEAERARTH